MNTSNLKSIVRGAYDIQALRIQMGGRIVANFKAKLGMEPSVKEETADKDAKKVLDYLKAEYKLITDGMASLPRTFSKNGDSLISSMTELVLIDQYFTLEKDESKHFRQLGKVLCEYEIYTHFLEGVKGIGPAMAGVIISEIDIHRSKYSSSIWKYAGLDVARDGKGRSRKKEHLVDTEYTDKNGEVKTKKGISFNPFLKTKLVGVLGSSFLRAGVKDNPYRAVYDNYRDRLDNNPLHDDKSKGHKYNMAIRYMVKMFIVDLYKVWRKIEGLEVHAPYSEAKLGLHHGKDTRMNKTTN